MHVSRLREAPEEIATHQIDQICTPQVISTEGLLTPPNGGSRVSSDAQRQLQRVREER